MPEATTYLIDPGNRRFVLTMRLGNPEPVAADVSPLKLWDMLASLKPTDERMSQLTLAATMDCMDVTKKLPGEGFKHP